MSLKYSVRYRIDVGVAEDQKISGKKNPPRVNPVGATTEYVGTPEEIKKRLQIEIDEICMRLEDLYYDRTEVQ